MKPTLAQLGRGLRFVVTLNEPSRRAALVDEAGVRTCVGTHAEYDRIDANKV